MHRFYAGFLVSSLFIGCGIKVTHVFHYHLDEEHCFSTHDHVHDASHHLAFIDLSILPTIENSFSWNPPLINQNQRKINVSQNEYFIQRFFQFISSRAPPH
ncbi:MAG: hypothetical protein OXC92_02515 [Flavobacteriaceae bacterium]|nr:hypothetical protein [Flavobacteriaceae bacterium]